MGQKVNPKIFRLGIKKNQWDSRYFEKKKEETTLYNYQNIEIQSYLKQFLFLNGLMLQKTKFHFNDTNLYIHISYFSTKKSFLLINKKTPNQNIILQNNMPQNFKPRQIKRHFRDSLVRNATVKPKVMEVYRRRTTYQRWPSLILKSISKQRRQKSWEIAQKSSKSFLWRRKIPSPSELVKNSKNILEKKYFLDLPYFNKKKKLTFFLFKKLAAKKKLNLFKKLAAKPDFFAFKRFRIKNLSFSAYKKYAKKPPSSLFKKLAAKKNLTFSLFKKLAAKNPLSFSVFNTLVEKENLSSYKELVKKKTLSSFQKLVEKESFSSYKKFVATPSFFLFKKKPRYKKTPWYKNTPWYKKELKERNQLKMSRLGIINSYKTFLQHQKYKSNAILKKNLFLEQFLEGLSLYTNKKYNVFLTFQNLNRGMTVLLPQIEKDFIKKRLLSLKRYSKEKFFKESLNVMLIVIKIKKSAKLFGQLIVHQFKFLKRHNYFLTFIKRIVTLFISFKISKVKGIKICISGRFNRASRAKSRLIIVGDMPIQTISKQIDYHETTSYTKNGTFGIKLWVNYD